MEKRINVQTTIRRNESARGVRIEDRVEKLTTTKEPITDGAPITYTERKDGVRPEFDIRTDRWDIAVSAMDAVGRAEAARGGNIITLPDRKEGETGGENSQEGETKG